METDKILDISHRIEKGGKTPVTVLGKTFMIGDTKRNIMNKIYDIQFKVSGEWKSENKRRKFMDTADAKIASLFLLNELANIPFLHSIHWRIINKRYTTETLSAIISTGLDNPDYAFFLKNSVRYQNMVMMRKMMIK